MQYAERLPSLPTPKTLVAPLAALALGAAVATGAYALIDDNDQIVQEPSKVIVVDTPAPAGPGTSAKDEAGTAAAISPTSGPSEGVSAKDEAGTAAAISALELRGSKASDNGGSGHPSTGSQESVDPHDTAKQLHRFPNRIPAP